MVRTACTVVYAILVRATMIEIDKNCLHVQQCSISCKLVLYIQHITYVLNAISRGILHDQAIIQSGTYIIYIIISSPAVASVPICQTYI